MMSVTVFVVVLFAAFLHALWNSMVKGDGDKQLAIAAVVFGHVPIALVLIPFVDFPAPASWPYIVSGGLLHVGYQVFLARAYRAGDLSQVYPIARGSAPLMVTIVSVSFLGVALTSLQLLAIVIIAVGIMSICMVRGEDAKINYHGAGLALITGMFIASYSLVDGLGARLAGTAVGYYSWLTVINSLVFLVVVLVDRPRIFQDIAARAKTVFIVGGIASFAAYALVIWAFTQAPIALVTALRETSIVFALLISTYHLKERFGWGKLTAVILTFCGVVLLRINH